MDHNLPEHEQSAEESFSEDAIEQAYLQALQASEEAGLTPAFESQFFEEEEVVSSLEEETTDGAVEKEAEEDQPVSAIFRPQQILEALLFVGGEKLSAKKMAGILGQHCREESVRDWIEEINARYLNQQRPYEIVLGDDGYQMSLRAEFQTQRHLLFGLGPKEVKLPQEALEVLSFIAYQQPVSHQQIKDIDNAKATSAVRQLVRRELVSSEKDDEGTVQYRTTDRFLRLFKLSSLEELPRAHQIGFK